MRNLNKLIRGISLIAVWFGDNNGHLDEDGTKMERETYDAARQNFEKVIASLDQIYQINRIYNEDFRKLSEYLRSLKRLR